MLLKVTFLLTKRVQLKLLVKCFFCLKRERKLIEINKKKTQIVIVLTILTSYSA